MHVGVLRKYAPAILTTTHSCSMTHISFCRMPIPKSVRHLYLFASDARSCICWMSVPYPNVHVLGRNFTVTHTVPQINSAAILS